MFRKMNVSLIALIVSLISFVFSYNIDVNHAIIVQPYTLESSGDYFGYSVVLYRDSKNYSTGWLKIGAPKRKNSGMVYHCPFMKPCQVDETFNYSSRNLNNAWVGGTMDVSMQYKTLWVSASRWQDVSPNAPVIPGGFFFQNLSTERVEKIYCPLKKPQYEQMMPYYARSMAGFAVHFPENNNEVFVGAPAVYNFLGTVFRLQNLDKPAENWTYQIVNPSGQFNEYAGYAVTSGRFYRRSEVTYVSGLPKGYENSLNNYKPTRIPTGAVFVFFFTSRYINEKKYENQVKIKAKEIIYGDQFGEYFGSALTSGDLDRDGLDDLVAGAPFRCNDNRGYNHGSVYVFYGNHKSLDNHRKIRLDGIKSGGLFGAAIMVLGDLDMNGFKELAISAPNEEGSGAVYIYSFDLMTKALKLSQRISGKTISGNLRGFGSSFSKGVDIDSNGFLDFAVGAPLSGHAVLLRAIPTVTVYTDIRVNSSFSKSHNIFNFTCCYYFVTMSPLNNLTIIRNVTVDREFYRFYIRNHVRRQYFEEKVLQIKPELQFCEDVQLVKQKGTVNYNDSITIELTYKLPRDPRQDERNVVVIKNEGSKDTFCSDCPILSRKSVIRQRRLVIWDHNCEHYGRKEPCKARLEVRARFSNLGKKNAFVLGSKESLDMKIEFENKGDPAYSPILHVYMPNGTVLESGPASCLIADINVVKCDAGEVLENQVSYQLRFNLNPEEALTNLSFFLNSTTITENISDKGNISLTLMLVKEADFYISGYSKESSYLLNEQSPSTQIQNIFKIEKFGPSPIQPLKVEIIVPYKLRSLKDGSFAQFAKILPYNKSDHSLVSCSDHITTYKGKISYAPVKRQSKAYSISCAMENIACALLDCVVGPFEGAQNNAEVSIDVEVSFETIRKALGKDWLANFEQILYMSSGAVTLKNFEQSGTRSDVAELANVVLLYKEVEVSLWIFIGSAVVGFLILVCVAVALSKAGFFERKEHKMLLQLKEEALKEEKLIEEMIEKELQSGEPFQGDPVFRYINPEDLQTYWKHLDEKEASDPLLKSKNAAPPVENAS
ncbi:integrin alpha-PS4-like [Euwallacea fornicatus]|uniref:integrin alpha-PS4-like n=1 Tax=Euwallacea fornicatus TaxID=995702 RepID=UPI00338DC69B